MEGHPTERTESLPSTTGNETEHERLKKAQEARELGEKLKVRCRLPLVWQNVTLTPPQRELERKE